MIEYAALMQADFAEMLRGCMQDVTAWLEGIPSYWYIIAAVLFVIFIRLLTRGGFNQR